MYTTTFFYSGAGGFTINISQYVIIQENVKTNTVLAASIFTLGHAISAFLWPIIYKVLLDTYSWRGAFLIQGAIVLHNAVLILLETSDLIKDKSLDSVQDDKGIVEDKGESTFKLDTLEGEDNSHYEDCVDIKQSQKN